MRRIAAAVSLLTFGGCSLLVTDKLPSGYQVEQGVMPDCSQSNMPAGVDLLLFLASAIGAAAAFHEAEHPEQPPAPDDPTPTENREAGAALTAAALLSGYSMVRGFGRSSECRAAVAAAGFEPSGGNDWLVPPLILLTIGVAAAARGSSFDPDSCTAYAIRTAVCRDGTYSCSVHRAGTCSHHLGVSEWL